MTDRFRRLAQSGIVSCILVGSAWGQASGPTSDVGEARKLVQAGLVTASTGDWLKTRELFEQGSSIRNFPEMPLLLAAVNSKLEERAETYRYSKLFRFDPARMPAHYRDTNEKLTRWAYPAVIASSLDCPLPKKDLTKPGCEIDKTGALVKFVKLYFAVDCAADSFKCKALELDAPPVVCGTFSPSDPPAFSFRDTEERCRIRRIFGTYSFPAPPELEFPTPDVVNSWN